jgi:hypothetical protein
VGLSAYLPHYKEAFAFDPIFPFRCIRLAPSLKFDLFREQTVGYFVPIRLCFEPLGWILSTGFIRSAWLVELQIANPVVNWIWIILLPILALLGLPAYQPISLVLYHDGSDVPSLSLSLDSCSTGFQDGFPSYRLFTPLQALMASLEPGGNAFTAALAEWDLRKTLTHKTNKLSSNKGLKCELNPVWITLLEPGIPPISGFLQNETH